MGSLTFEFADLGTVFFLIILEGLLSADNALVLAIMCRHLPSARQQRSALTWGLAMSFVFRCVAILFVTQLIAFWWLQAIGAAYLLYLLVKHFLSVRSGSSGGRAAGRGYWATVVALGITDVAFAIDSVLAAVATEPRPDKIWIVFIGAFAGVVLLRFAATVFIKLLAKYPLLDHLAYLLVGWVGVKLAFLAGHSYMASYNVSHATPLPYRIPEMPLAVFWGVLGILIVGGVSLAVGKAGREESMHALDEEPDEADDE
ncbi:MAG: tellurium resistance protein TerC [Armatimonadetes bacterium]|nr:tellurium resistance protein TerC [Armatimonadota bacterium]